MFDKPEEDCIIAGSLSDEPAVLGRLVRLIRKSVFKKVKKDVDKLASICIIDELSRAVTLTG